MIIVIIRDLSLPLLSQSLLFSDSAWGPFLLERREVQGKAGRHKKSKNRRRDIYFLNNLRNKANQSSRLIPKKSKYCQPNKKVKKEGNLGSGIKQMVKNLCTSRLLLTQIFHSSYFYHYPFLFSLFVFTISFAHCI